MLIDGAPFVVKGLLHPEAGRGTVEKAEQGKMVILSSVVLELDDRSRLLEDLAAPIQHEVVVRGNEGKSD